MRIHGSPSKTMSANRGSPRRAAVTILATLLIVLAALLAVLVVDASYVIAVNRGMQDVTGIMALAGHSAWAQAPAGGSAGRDRGQVPGS